MRQGPKKFFLQPVTSSSTTWMVLALLILTVSFAWVGKEMVENKCFMQHLSDKGEKCTITMASVNTMSSSSVFGI